MWLISLEEQCVNSSVLNSTQLNKHLWILIYSGYLYRFVCRDYGNTSPSSTYYVLAYLESLVGISKGQKLLQVGPCTPQHNHA